MTANAIDLTTVAAVKSWIGISGSNTSEDSTIQDAITAFSAQVLHMTGRGPMNGGYPTASPFVTPQSYSEVYDGSGSLRQPIRNWPITAVSSLSINGVTVPQSTSVNVYGWVIDGDGKFVSIRSGYSTSVAGLGNYRFAGNAYPSGAGFCSGVQNVLISYTAGFSAVPFDLEMAARKTVGLYYKRRGWIGQRSQNMAAGAGSIFFDTSEMEPDVVTTIMYYKRRAA